MTRHVKISSYKKTANTVSIVFSIALAICLLFSGFNIKYSYAATTQDNSSLSQTLTGNDLARQIEREGLAMLKNDNNILPLSKSVNKVNVFGRGAIEWYLGGSGSGGVGATPADHALNLVDALKEYGISVNQELIDDSVKAVPKDNQKDTLVVPTEQCAVITEPGIDKYQNAYNNAKNFSDVAIVALSRYSGEGNDLPKTQYKVNGNPNDPSRTYLDISTEEEDLIRNVAKDYKKVIVIVNCTTTFNLSFLETIDGIGSCLVVGTTGNKGTLGICDVLFGDYSPCGHLVDTYTKEWYYNPTYYLTGYENLGVYEDSDIHNSTKGNTRGEIGRNHAVYADYEEGIYVGYKWFETADHEGYWKDYGGYNNVVQYPFGYGLSYTTFDWEIVTDQNKPNDDIVTTPAIGSSIDDKSQITVAVKVTNTGKVAGKDVVQAYLTAPYTPGGIEKSYVSLVGFAKTPILNPGESTYLKINMKANDFKSFDYNDANHNGFSGYELEKGDYVIRLRTDSHNDKNMKTANNIVYKVVDDIKIENDEVSSNPVKPIFSGSSAVDGFAIDGSDSKQNINYFSRSNFPKLRTSKPTSRSWNKDLEVSRGQTIGDDGKWNAYSQEMAKEWDSKSGKDAFGFDIPTTKPVFGTGTCEKLYDEPNNKLTQLGMKLAQDFNSDDWNTVLNAFTWDECMKIIGEGVCTIRQPMPTIGRISQLLDFDGPSQMRVVTDKGTFCTGYPSPTITAMNWSETMYYNMGRSYGQDMIDGKRDGAFAFGCDIHHTPFCGRNFEYYSEDGFISGRVTAQACKGVQSQGKTTFLKHFVVNDSEQWRCGMYTWLTEQAFREIYAKPFEMAVKEGNTTGIMTSFNRLGATWAGGSEAALQGLMRNEWGFRGAILTDYGEDTHYMDMAQAVRAGGNQGNADKYTDGAFKELPTYDGSSIRFANRLRELCKESIYTFIRPYYLHATYKGVINDEDVTIDKKSFVFDGTEHHPNITVTKDGATLKKDIDYQILGPSSVKNAQEVTNIIKGIGKYTGEVYVTWRVTPISLAGATVVLDKDIFTYDGIEQGPNVKVILEGHELIRDVDYTLENDKAIEPSTYKLIVNGVSNYYSSKTAQWTINPASTPPSNGGDDKVNSGEVANTFDNLFEIIDLIIALFMSSIVFIYCSYFAKKRNNKTNYLM